jgi:hypothetical protein
MLRVRIALLVIACSSRLLALEVVPPAPDSRTFIRVQTYGSPCPIYVGSDVVVDGSTITVTPIAAPVLPGGGCVGSVVRRWVDVGLVEPGVYTISVPQPGGPDSAPLIVRDADSGILVSPVGGSTAGTRSVQIFGARGGDTVLFDGIAVPVQQTARGFVVVTPPPHPPGTVDVTVIGATVTRKAVAAYTYFEPAAAPDPYVFEPYLFPIAYDGRGEFGSQWRTENRMGTGQTLVRFRQTVPMAGCVGDCRGFNWTAALASQSQSGLLIWTVRRRLPDGIEDDFRVSSRVIELSKLHGAGTSVPVVGEGDFRGSFTFEKVPLGGNARVALRLYSIVGGQSTNVVVTLPTGERLARVLDLPAVNGVRFAAIDLTPPSAGQRAESATVTVVGTKVWGLLTITDNSTQEVTALWPN